MKDRPAVYAMLHKPSGFECSRSPSSHRSVFDLLPEEFLRLGVQPVGRLDADATGLLLLTNDGELNHVLTSPRRKLPKIYRVGLRHPLTDAQIEALEKGVVLRDDPKPTSPAEVKRLSEREAEVVITEGRYHQVKRMFAAVSNRVESIHRTALWRLRLGELEPGKWRPLTQSELDALGKK